MVIHVEFNSKLTYPETQINYAKQPMWSPIYTLESIPHFAKAGHMWVFGSARGQQSQRSPGKPSYL